MRRTVRAVAVANPAAGAGFAFTPASNQPSKLRSLTFLFATAVAVANRQVIFGLADQNGLVVFQNDANAVQAASVTNTYVASDVFGVGFTSGTLLGIGYPDMWLPPNWQVQVTVGAIQAADQISGIAYGIEYGWAEFERDQALQEIVATAQAAMAG